MIKLIDSHCHLTDSSYQEDLDKVIERAQEKGVEYCIVSGYDIPSSKRAIELAYMYPCIYATVGIHPEESKSVDGESIQEIEELASDPKVVAIGEIGLDYYHKFSTEEKQKEVFISQLEIANKTGLPVVIHSRSSDKDTYKIIKKYAKTKGIMHCFSGTSELARRYIELGFLISISGVITFKNSKKLKNVVKTVDICKLTVETDAPYLTPHPYRGKRNEPAYVYYIAEEISRIKGLPLQEVALHIYKNTKQLFTLS